MSCPVRTYPLRRPINHRPPIPRWHLVLGDGIDRVFTAYVGVQQHSRDSLSNAAASKLVAAINECLNQENGHAPLAFETFTVIDGDDKPGAYVWVCYWDDEAMYNKSINNLDLGQLLTSLSSVEQHSVGIWCERFSTRVSRLETNYSGLDYLPGLARVPGTKTKEHTLSAYWGAARDRIPESAHNRFNQEEDSITRPPSSVPPALGQHLVGTNYENLVHIRSGQFWENCGPDETESYEMKLEPTLRQGLKYLWENPLKTGTIGLRFLRNTDLELANGRQSKETCGAGFFRSLADLEAWAEKHKSHLAIYLGAIKHAKLFGAERKLRTWHEVSVLKRGEAHFEYLNCIPNTGAIRFLDLQNQSI